MKITYLLLLLLLTTPYVNAQQNIADSLRRILPSLKEDTNKINVLLDIAREYYSNTNYSLAQQFIDHSFSLSNKLNYKSGQIKYYLLEGRIQKNLGNYIESQQAYFTALSFSEAIKDSDNIASSYNSIGNLLIALKKYDDATKYLRASLNMYNKIGMIKKSAYPMSNIGKIYQAQHLDDKAMLYYKNSLVIAQQYGDYFEMAQTYKRIASIYIRQNNFTSAFAYCDSTFILSQKFNYKSLIADIYDIRGQIYLDMKNYNRARIEYTKGLQIYTALQIKPSIQNSYKQLSLLDSIQGNFEEAFKHYKLFHVYNDSILNLENNIKLEREKMQYALDKKDIFAKAAQNKKDEEAKRNSTILWSGIGLVSLLTIFLFLYSRQKLITKRTLELAQTKNRISRDLHDEIGSTLSSITMQTNVLKKRILNHEDVGDLINNISLSSKNIMSTMSDIVWSLNQANENMSQLIERLDNYCALSLTPSNIDYTLKYDDDIFNVKPNTIQLKEIYFISKEAINNSMKYAQCNHLQISFSLIDKHINIEIEDDGIGFSSNHTNINMGGEGLKNMKSRAEKLNGKLEMTSSKNHGTCIRLVIPIILET